MIFLPFRLSAFPALDFYNHGIDNRRTGADRLQAEIQAQLEKVRVSWVRIVNAMDVMRCSWLRNAEQKARILELKYLYRCWIFEHTEYIQ